MRNALILLLVVHCIGQADRLAVQSVGCKEVSTFEKLTDAIVSDPVLLQQFAGNNGCAVLSPADKLQVVTQDPNTSSGRFFQIVLERTGENFFVPRKAVIIEQPGSKNRFTF